MFRKIKLKLTLINIAVVGIVLLLFFSGIYILMKQNTVRQSQQLLRSVAGEIRQRGQRSVQPPQTRRWSGSFYVKFDSGGTLLEQSKELPVTEAELETMLEVVFSKEKDMDTVSLGTESYRYYRSFPPDLRDVIVVFLNMQPEREILARLGTILASSGLAGLLIVFVSSLFMADKALIPIKQAWERQTNFVADASHELRTPLAVMQTSLELVMGNREESVESQTKWLENIQAENRRMTKLVDDLLFLARADSNQQLIEKQLFPLHEKIAEVMAAFEPIAVKKNIQLTLHIENEIHYYGDQNRLKQLIVILLDNAIKYTPAGGRTEVALRQLDNQAELVVSDTGEGMSSEHLDKIFQRFYRIDKARSRDGGGTGLGLSIADWIVREHKGTITVTSTPGGGSTFKVQLPVLLQKA